MENKGKAVRNSLSIDIEPEEYQKIKLFATIKGIPIKEFILNSIRERSEKEEKESEEKQLLAMTNQITPVLKKVWDNDKDEAFFKISK